MSDTKLAIIASIAAISSFILVSLALVAVFNHGPPQQAGFIRPSFARRKLRAGLGSALPAAAGCAAAASIVGGGGGGERVDRDGPAPAMRSYQGI